MKNWPGIRYLNELPPVTMSQIPILENKTGAWRTVRPYIDNKTPPCNEACPAGENIEKIIVLVKQGKFREAWQLIMEENPFPGCCGRVCFHPCETSCNRNELDTHITINTIERAIFDLVVQENLMVQPPIIKSKKEQVAIVGSGPAGLTCAYHLSLMGYNVTIFEALPVLGGMLRVGIPEYRLPKDILKKEIDTILSFGVKVKANTRLGMDISLNELMDFDAVFIAIGAWKKVDLGIEGENYRNVANGLDLLCQLNLGKNVELGENIVVVGGGNTAIDVARSVLRKGTNPTILYRRTRQEMPAFKEEVLAAEEDGIRIIYLASPLRVLMGKGKTKGLECIKNQLGEEEADGRRKAIPIQGSNFAIEADTVVTATGEIPDLSFTGGRLAVENQSLEVNEFGATNLPGIFAGGDVAGGIRTVTEAIRWGKIGAISIDTYLMKKNPKEIFEPLRVGSKGAFSIANYKKKVEVGNKKVVHFADLNANYFESNEPMQPLSFMNDQEKSVLSKHLLNETNKIEAIEAIKESERCFNCGVCNLCGNCYLFCPDLSVSLDEEKGGVDINYDYCKGCGICAKECPRGVISIKEESK